MTTLGIAPVSKKSIEVQAADALRNAIVDGHIAPGSRITETQLATQMGLSRATIRTALHQLLKEGLTVLIPYTGWTIIDLSADDVWELYTLRSSLERLAAGMLASSGDKSRLAAFEKAFNALKRACASGDRAKIAESAFGLHKADRTMRPRPPSRTVRKHRAPNPALHPLQRCTGGEPLHHPGAAQPHC